MPPGEITPLLETGISRDPTDDTHNKEGKFQEEDKEDEEEEKDEKDDDDYDDDDDDEEEIKESVKQKLAEQSKFRLFFMLYSCRRGFGSLLSLLLRQRGLAPWQIGAIRAGMHFPRFASRSLVTFFADHFQIRRTILILSILSWIFGFGAFMGVQPQERNRNCTGVISSDCNRTDYLSNALNGSTTESADVLDWLYESDDLRIIFILYIVIAVIAAPLQGVTNPLINAAVFDSLGKDKNKYGWHKAFGGFGNISGHLICSYLLSIKEHTMVYCSISVTLTEFWGPYFFFASAMMCSLLVVTCWFPPQTRYPKLEKNSFCLDLKNFGSNLWDLEISANLLAAGWMGLTSGISTGFLFWHVATMGSSFLVMGVIGAASSIAETLAYIPLPVLSRLCDYTPVTIVALTLISIRFLLYAWLTNPWWYIVAHGMKGLSNACIENNVRVTLSSRTKSPEYSSSMQSLFSTANSLGTTLGNLIGGVLISGFGAPVAFVSVALGSCITNIAFIGLTQIVRYNALD